MSKTKAIRIRKSDYARVLATESMPYETPIIFSNDGLYQNVRAKVLSNPIANFIKSSLIDGTIGDTTHSTIPFSYQIRKNSLEFRRLSLIHPNSQMKIMSFYEKYEKLILYYCSLSDVTIRSPLKIASTYYKKSSWENIHKYKTGSVAESWSDGIAKHSPSFFSYRFDRLYKFYNSKNFFNLEKKYDYFLTLDVAKCFDSIYTHSLSWATKDKEFTKQQVKVGSTFPQEFDAVMRHCNHNETSGIVIGPEVSRVFAEIIFQAVDNSTIKKLKNDDPPLALGVDYSLKRYVDDVFIFAHNEKTARKVYDSYADSLNKFNLHPNASKSELFRRPFQTMKSRLINDAGKMANSFLEKFLDSEKGNNSKLVPKEIYNKWTLSRSFLTDIKSLCSENKKGYDEVSSYLISIFFERIKRLANVDLSGSDQETKALYKDAYLLLLDVIYFLYGVAPSVSASYKLCTSIIIIIRFSKKYLDDHDETIKQRIFELSSQLLEAEVLNNKTNVEHFCSLESINIVLAIKELGDKYPISINRLTKIFGEQKESTYFDIISGLFYIGSDNKYSNLKKKLVADANRKLSDMSNIRFSTEKCCLLLDLLSCPHIHKAQKLSWLKKLYKAYGETLPSTAELNEFLDDANKPVWFVNWQEVDLLNSLEKKELKQAY